MNTKLADVLLPDVGNFKYNVFLNLPEVEDIEIDRDIFRGHDILVLYYSNKDKVSNIVPTLKVDRIDKRTGALSSPNRLDLIPGAVLFKIKEQYKLIIFSNLAVSEDDNRIYFVFECDHCSEVFNCYKVK